MFYDQPTFSLVYEVDRVTCSACKKINQPGARYCRFCGVALYRARRRLHGGRLALLLSVGLLLGMGWETVKLTDHLPSVAHLVSRFQRRPTSLVYDADGQVIARLGGPEHPVVPLNHIAPALPEALIAIEDHNFYHNPGFDLKSIARAALVDLLHRAPLEGASTITEQLAKDLYLSDQKSLSRKLQEFLLGLELNQRYSKQQILDMYLNAVYFGQGADGVAAAAHVYFDTTPDKLSLAQATLLAGLPQAPSWYDPVVHLKLAKQRQAEVVAAMVRYHDISAAQGRRILHAPLKLRPESPAGPSDYPYPWYIDQVVAELLGRGLSMQSILHGGLHIDTALRPRVYRAAQSAVDQWMNKNFHASRRLYPDHQAAVIVENPHNGHVWAIIGGRRHFTFLQDDLAVDELRSTGSAIKPLLDYAPALARGYTEMSVIQDVPIFRHIAGQAWWPSNDDGIYRGYLDLRDALAISDNDVAVHLLNRIGIGFAVHFLKTRFQIGLPAGEGEHLDIALGVDTNLLDLTRGYAALDNHGTLLDPVFVTRVTRQGQVLFQANPHPHRAVTPDQAFILTNMLRRVLDPRALPNIGPESYATGYQLGIGRPAAAKSGTNNNEADAWFIGYEPQMVVGVWEGDRLGEIAQPYTEDGDGPAYGAVAAGPIWRQIMRTANQALHLPPRPFPRPLGVHFVRRISITSGERPTHWTPRDEIQGGWFINGTQPTGLDPTWRALKVMASDPARRWRPGCGADIIIPVLKRESDWHPGVPRPWDAKFWAPRARCRPVLARPPHGASHRHGKPRS